MGTPTGQITIEMIAYIRWILYCSVEQSVARSACERVSVRCGVVWCGMAWCGAIWCVVVCYGAV